MSKLKQENNLVCNAHRSVRITPFLGYAPWLLVREVDASTILPPGQRLHANEYELSRRCRCGFQVVISNFPQIILHLKAGRFHLPHPLARQTRPSSSDSTSVHICPEANGSQLRSTEYSKLEHFSMGGSAMNVVKILLRESLTIDSFHELIDRLSTTLSHRNLPLPEISGTKLISSMQHYMALRHPALAFTTNPCAPLDIVSLVGAGFSARWYCCVCCAQHFPWELCWVLFPLMSTFRS